MKVKNTNAHRAADREYFFATHVKSEAGAGEDDVVMLLLTDKELERARKACRQKQRGLAEIFCNRARFDRANCQRRANMSR